MRGSARLIALVALVALVAMRGVGLAAVVVASGEVECCCGRHPIDQDCGCPDCPSHHRAGHHHDRHAQLHGCTGQGFQGVTAEFPSIVLPVAPITVAPSFALVAARPAAPAPPGRVVHPVTPPS